MHPIPAFLAARDAYRAAELADVAANTVYAETMPADLGPDADEAALDAYEAADTAAWLASGCARTSQAKLNAERAMVQAMVPALRSDLGAVPADVERLAAVVLTGRAPAALRKVVALCLAWSPSQVSA